MLSTWSATRHLDDPLKTKDRKNHTGCKLKSTQKRTVAAHRHNTTYTQCCQQNSHGPAFSATHSEHMEDDEGMRHSTPRCYHNIVVHCRSTYDPDSTSPWARYEPGHRSTCSTHTHTHTHTMLGVTKMPPGPGVK